jgi:DNA/RNA-binding domain of Phe-tRNA-synthetase-like protein
VTGEFSPAPTQPAAGWVAPEVAAEFPGLRLHWVTADVRRRSSPEAVVARLAHIASRYRGASVVTMRTRPIPRAYRVFYRQIGLDPDVERVPAERAAVQRLLDGGFRSVGLVADACLIALLETAVPVWALDAEAVAAPGLGIRTTTDEDAGAALRPGSLAVADGSRVHALLFSDPAPPTAAGPRTSRVALFSVAVAGVPDIHVEEALWMGAELISGQPPW